MAPPGALSPWHEVLIGGVVALGAGYLLGFAFPAFQSAAALAAVAALGAVGVWLVRLSRWGIAMKWWVGVGVATVALAAVIVLIGPTYATVQCDGSVPEWMIPADYGGGGCVEIRPGWEAKLPWNAGRTNLVCLGLCGGSETPYPARR